MDKILTRMHTFQNKVRCPTEDDASITEHEHWVITALKHDIRSVLMTESSILHPDSVQQILNSVVRADESLHRIGGPVFWNVVVNSALQRAMRLPEDKRQGFLFHEIMKTVVNDRNAFCGVKGKEGAKYGSLAQCKRKRQTRYWGAGWLKTTYAGYAQVYHPWRMEAGDVDFEYDRNDERLLKLLGGEKIAFKRGAEPDGNCWWYAYFESKAYQARESITQAELHKRVLEKKKEIGKVIDNYLKDREKLGIGNFGPNFSQNEADWKKKIKDELKDKKWASDSMASLVAFHDKTDVYNVNTKEVTGFPGRVGDRVKKGKGKRKANARHIKDNAHPPTSKDEADESMRQFAGIEANKDIPFNYQWSPLNASIVAVRYKKVPGGLKIQVSFGRDREFMDWLLLAKSRVLAGMGISALGLYADQYLPAGKVIGLYTGRILGEFEPQTTKDLVETPLTGFRHGILTMIGDDDKLLLHSYNDGAKGVRPIVRLVDGGRGAPTSGTKIGQTYDPLGVGVIFPWTYACAHGKRSTRVA
eukprot:jgi/Mesvir1/18230/Mv09509-RA.1